MKYTEEEITRAKEMTKTFFQLGEIREYGYNPDIWFMDDTENLSEIRDIICKEFVKFFYDENYDRGEKDINAIKWINDYRL